MGTGLLQKHGDKQMNKILFSCMFLVCFFVVGQEIASGGKSDYVIVTKENAPKVTVYCASHLKKYMKLVADVVLK